MMILRSLTLTAAAAVCVVAFPANAQEYYYSSEPASQLFSAEELDNLVAPVALYPDPILAQLFVAATYADQVDIAARHVRVFGTSGIDNQPWDVSVRAVAYYPPVLNMLADRTDWTTAVGQAYAVQPEDLMDAVQRLRWMAREHGNLVSTNEQVVIVEQRVVRIVPAHARYIYVPVYRPEIMYYRPAGFYAHVRSGSWTFGVGFPIGAWLNYDCDWNRRRIYYDGWRGKGWRVASRPHVQNVNIYNIYINPRYEVVNINRTIVNRRVNHQTLVNNNAVHRNVTFDGYPRRIAEVVESERRQARALPASRSVQPAAPQSASARAQPAQRSAPTTQRSESAQRPSPNPQRTATSTTQRSAPPEAQRSAPPTAQRSAPPTAQRSAPPTAQRSAPPTAQRSAPPTAQRSAPPTAQRSAPPTAQRSAPPTAQRSASPTAQRSAPPTTQRSAPPTAQRSAPPTTQRSAPPTAQRSAPPTAQRSAPPTAQRGASPARPAPPSASASSRADATPTRSATPSRSAPGAATATSSQRPSKAKDNKGGE